MDQYILYTNLSAVKIGSVRTKTMALLLCDEEGAGRGRRYSVRGFGVGPEIEIFDMDIVTPTHSVEWKGELGILHLDGVSLELTRMIPQQDLHKLTIAGEAPDALERVLAFLPMSVRMFWIAPSVPVLHHILVAPGLR